MGLLGSFAPLRGLGLKVSSTTLKLSSRKTFRIRGRVLKANELGTHAICLERTRKRYLLQDTASLSFASDTFVLTSADPRHARGPRLSVLQGHGGLYRQSYLGKSSRMQTWLLQRPLHAASAALIAQTCRTASLIGPPEFPESGILGS